MMKDKLKLAIIEANTILSDWTNLGKNQSKILFDVNGMVKTSICKNLKTSDYKTSSVIVNSIEIECILNDDNTIKGIVSKYSYHYRADKNLHENIRTILSTLDYKELANSKKKEIKELEQIDYKTIKEIVF